jgi:hypothetical protein
MTGLRTPHKDVMGGVLISAVGVAVAIHSLTFQIGTLSRMGPGYFPLALGVILTLSGLAILVKGFLAVPRPSRTQPEQPFEWKACLLICLGIATFVILAKYAGMVVATFAIVFISALADRQNSWRAAAILALAMVVVSVVVFWWALQIQLPLFKWGGA